MYSLRMKFIITGLVQKQAKILQSKEALRDHWGHANLKRLPLPADRRWGGRSIKKDKQLQYI